MKPKQRRTWRASDSTGPEPDSESDSPLFELHQEPEPESKYTNEWLIIDRNKSRPITTEANLMSVRTSDSTRTELNLLLFDLRAEPELFYVVVDHRTYAHVVWPRQLVGTGSRHQSLFFGKMCYFIFCRLSLYNTSIYF